MAKELLPDNGPLDSKGIADCAQKIDRIIHNLYLARHEGSKSDFHHHIPNLLKVLTRHLNELARSYGIVGAGIGVVDVNLNKWEHFKDYDSSKVFKHKKNEQLNFMPYSTPTRKEVEGWYKKEFSTERIDLWLNNLFFKYREHQKVIGEATEGTAEHYHYLSRFRNGKAPVFIVSCTNICNEISNWLQIIIQHAFLKSKVSGSCQTGTLDVFREKTLMQCIDDLIHNEELDGGQHGSNFNRIWPECYSNIFFNEIADTTWKDQRGHLRSFCKSVKISDIVNRFHLQLDKILENLEEDTLGEVVDKLNRVNRKSKVPIIPYLVLCMIYEGHLHHLIWPFARSTDEEHGSYMVSYPAALLATAVTESESVKEEELLRRLYPFSLLMRQALEPFTDLVFYKGIKAREERRLGQKAGFLESAHDYSKDLNVMDRLVATFLEELSEIETSVDGLLADSPERQRISRSFQQLHRLKETLNLRNRFMMAHERTESQSRFFPQPEWCVNFVRDGRRKDLYDLIRVLVWHPLGWVRYHQLSENSDGKVPLPYSEVADWSRLFAYDERGTQPQVEESLGAYLSELFLAPRENDDEDAPRQSGISVEEFGKLHPPPLLNDHCGMDDQILWSALSEQELATRWLPHAELLPLLVFSLRAAFQHAWLRTFFDASEGRSGIAQHIHLQAGDELHSSGHYSIYRLSLDFPMPAKPIGESIPAVSVSLPWGDWSRQMAHYRGKTRPWEYSLTIEPPLDPPGDIIQSAIHTDKQHFRISIQTGI